MLIKFLSNKKGDVKRLVDYLVREKDSAGIPRKPLPEILAGDPEQLILLAETLPFKQKYQTGVISFAPGDDPTEEQQAEVMAYFERAAFPGLDRDQYDILWVRHAHTDENRCELHFVIPCVELTSRKSLSVTDPKSHLYYYSALRDYFNFKYNWADPNDPARRRDLQPGYLAYIDRQNERIDEYKRENPEVLDFKGKKREHIKQQIHNYIQQQINDGVVHDRYSMELVLKIQGFTITRNQGDYISIVRGDYSRPIRLKGKIYEREWRVDQQIDRRIQNQGDTKQGVTGEDYQRRVGELQADLERRISNRAKRFNQRYSKAKWDEYYSTLIERNLDDRESLDDIHQPQSININTAKQFSTNQQIGGENDGLGKTITQLIDPIQRRLSEGHETAGRIDKSLTDAVRRIETETRQADGGTVSRNSKFGKELDSAIDGKTGESIQRNIRIAQRIKEFSHRIECHVNGIEKRAENIREADRNIQFKMQLPRTELYHARESVRKRYENNRYEMEDMKSKINLAEFAEDSGFIIDHKKSTRNFIKMDHPSGDKIIVGIDSIDKHYFYFNINDSSDSGSIVDFIQRRNPRANLGEVRKILRPWLDGSYSPPVLSNPARIRPQKLQPINKASRKEIMSRLIGVTKVDESAYLSSRNIDSEILQHWRFYGTIFQDSKGKLVFPHEDREGICGFEIKDKASKTFSKGGTKGLWRSYFKTTDKKLIICESVIDCLSYAKLYDPYFLARYIATGGRISSEGSSPQAEYLIQQLRDAGEKNMEIRIAFDNDPGGEQLLQDLIPYARKAGVKLTKHFPEGFKDWNEQLTATVEATSREQQRELKPQALNLDDDLEL